MIRLVAEDSTVVLDDAQVSKIRFWVLEFQPAYRCEVTRGPGVTIVVPDENGLVQDARDVAPGILAELEAIVGCRLRPA